MDGDRRRTRRVAWTGAGAVAFLVLVLASQALDGWRQRAYAGYFWPRSGLGQQTESLLAQITGYFSWRWSPTETIGQLGVVSLYTSIGPGSMAAQDLADLAYVALTCLFLAGVAASWRPRPRWVAQGAAVWGASALAAILSGLIVPQFFGAPGADGGGLVAMANAMANRAPGGILFGLFAALVVVITEAAVARRHPAPVAEEPETEGASAPPSSAPSEREAQPAGGFEAEIDTDGEIVVPEPRNGDTMPQPNGSAGFASSDVEFLGDFELGEAGPPNPGR